MERKIMGQSLSQLYVHLSFSTKYRKPAILPEIKEKLHSYMAGTLKKYESPALIINSVPDHIHILFRLSKNHALSKIVEEIKKGSSKWMKSQLNSKNGYLFSWQIGYSAFSVSGSKVNTVKKYISRQEEHHVKMNYKEEIERFMKEYDVIEFNPEYFWD
jgi:putative transposase